MFQEIVTKQRRLISHCVARKIDYTVQYEPLKEFELIEKQFRSCDLESKYIDL